MYSIPNTIPIKICIKLSPTASSKNKVINGADNIMDGNYT